MFLGFVSKGLSMVARILTTRMIGLEAMAIYTLASPAMVFLITLAQMGLPTAIATLISKHKERSKKIFTCGLILSCIISIIFMTLTIWLSPFLAKNVLKNESVTLTLYALALLIPLVGLSSLLKGYFIGHNRVKMTAKSSIAEEISRIIFVLLFLDHFTKIGPEYAAFGAMLGVCVGEVFQSLYLLTESQFHLYKRGLEIFNLKEIHPLEEIPGILSLSLPITLSRIVGSLTYFAEPILTTNMLLKAGYNANEIMLDYGVLNGYAMPILLLPGFFALALANYLLPNMASYVGKKEYGKAKKIFLNVLGISLGIGISMSIFFFFFGNTVLRILYHTEEGAKYIHYLAFPFILYYIESPLNNAMHALGLTKKAFITTVLSCIVRILSLLALINHFHIMAVALSTIFEIFLTIVLNGYHVLHAFSRYQKESAVNS